MSTGETETTSEQPISEAEKLIEQGYQHLLTIAGTQNNRQAVDICKAAIGIFEQAMAAGEEIEQKREARRGLAATYSQLGHQQRYAKNYPAAVAAFSEALKLNPTLADDYYYRARSFQKQGDEAAARRDFTEYLRRGEDDYLRSAAREQISSMTLKTGDNASQSAHWQQEGMRLTSEAGNVMHPRGDEAPNLPRAVAIYNKALDAFNRAVAADPKAMMAQIGLIGALSAQAECYTQMEEYDLAIDNYNRAFVVRPQPQYIFKRGEAYRAAGHQEQARADFERYIKEGNDRALKLQAQKYLEEKVKA